MRTIKNGEIALKLGRSYTYPTKYALILQFFEYDFGIRYSLGSTRVYFEPHMS